MLEMMKKKKCGKKSVVGVEKMGRKERRKGETRNVN